MAVSKDGVHEGCVQTMQGLGSGYASKWDGDITPAAAGTGKQKQGLEPVHVALPDICVTCCHAEWHQVVSCHGVMTVAPAALRQLSSVFLSHSSPTNPTSTNSKTKLMGKQYPGLICLTRSVRQLSDK